MGSRMAANVQKAGIKLIVHDLYRQVASHHIQAGATWADSPRALASQADVIFSSLPEPADVEAVALGPDGLIAGIRPGAAYFDLSTNSPSVVKAIHGAFAKKDAHMLDAPVSGGPAGAASRKLAIWVGGDESVFNRHKAVLDAIGDRAAYIGPIGSATVAKLVHNMSGYAIVCARRPRRRHANGCALGDPQRRYRRGRGSHHRRETALLTELPISARSSLAKDRHRWHACQAPCSRGLVCRPPDDCTMGRVAPRLFQPTRVCSRRRDF
jgi:6-phosphogluconate dehydrogenase-like protein